MKNKHTVVYIGGRKLGQLGKKIIEKYKNYFDIQYEFPKNNTKVDYLFNLFGEKIFTKSQLDRVNRASVNFHFGHLPQYRGRFIVSHLIANGEKRSFVTCHFIEEGIDTGDIIYESLVTIAPTDTAYSLFLKCTKIGAQLFEKVLKKLITGNELPRRKQVGRAHYYPKGQLNGDTVELSWDRKKIEDFIRATTYPPFYPHLIIKNEKYSIVKERYFKVKSKKL